jgi:catechol 2,3-dioxygenase-like lactoylglutathione lyase family enzyme
MADDRPVLDQINLVVRDMNASVEFYRRLGLDIPDRAPKWDSDHRSANTSGELDFDLDSTTFAAKWNHGGGAPGAVLGFKVATRDAVDRLYDDLTGAGYTGQQAPYDAFWGARYAVIEDPDGNAVGIMSPIDAARRSSTPSV